MTDPSRFERVASAVAHETGTPLSVVVSAIRLARERVDDPDTDELLEAALRNLRLIELQLGRFRHLRDPEQIAPQLRPLDLVQYVRLLLHDLEPTVLSNHPVTLEAPDEMTITTDGELVAQVLHNLLANAAAYSDAGKPIGVELATDGTSAAIVVRDGGEGVAPDDADRIFEPYERASDARGGAGLGLYLSRAIARQLGGDLELVPAAQDEGSVFRLTLTDHLAPGGTDGTY